MVSTTAFMIVLLAALATVASAVYALAARVVAQIDRQGDRIYRVADEVSELRARVGRLDTYREQSVAAAAQH